MAGACTGLDGVVKEFKSRMLVRLTLIKRQNSLKEKNKQNKPIPLCRKCSLGSYPCQGSADERANDRWW